MLSVALHLMLNFLLLCWVSHFCIVALNAEFFIIMLSVAIFYCYAECRTCLLLYWVSHMFTVSLSVAYVYSYTECRICLLIYWVSHMSTDILSVTYVYCCGVLYVDCHYAECCYIGYHYVVCHYIVRHCVCHCTVCHHSEYDNASSCVFPTSFRYCKCDLRFIKSIVLRKQKWSSFVQGW
jgi:hypothetical protein